MFFASSSTTRAETRRHTPPRVPRKTHTRDETRSFREKTLSIDLVLVGRRRRERLRASAGYRHTTQRASKKTQRGEIEKRRGCRTGGQSVMPSRAINATDLSVSRASLRDRARPVIVVSVCVLSRAKSDHARVVCLKFQRKKHEKTPKTPFFGRARRVLREDSVDLHELARDIALEPAVLCVFVSESGVRTSAARNVRRFCAKRRRAA